MSEPGEQPITLTFDDTTDLRVGPEIDQDLLSLLPLVGVWQGLGRGWWPVDTEPVEQQFAQRVTFSHDGRPFLAYESRIWVLGPDNSIERLGPRETGFWRPSGADDLAVTTTSSDGEVSVLLGAEDGQRWELQGNTAVVGGPDSLSAHDSHLWALVDGALGYVVERTVEGERSPLRNAALWRAEN